MTRPRPGGRPRPRRINLGAEPLEWTDPHSLTAHVERYLAWIAARGYAPNTVELQRRDLAYFCAWCAERSITRPPELSRLVIDLYQKHVAIVRKKDGTPLGWSTQRNRLHIVSRYCKWLARERLVLVNPAAELELPRLGIRLPRAILTAEEAERILAVPDVTTSLGVRDRAILEIFYSTGIRRTELARLAIRDIDIHRGVLSVWQGKGRKDRVVPIGERALAWVAKYLAEVRPDLATPADQGGLFLGVDGGTISPGYVGNLVARFIAAADIGKTGSCHLFRHTMATLMLEGGADVRFVQEMLGHACLSTTQIYTHVSIQALKAVHAATHPAAKLQRRARDIDEGIDTDALIEALDADAPSR